jgi:sensor c-di-GMP phosphodiesterase-like protein
LLIFGAAVLVALPVIGTLAFTYFRALERSRAEVDEVATTLAQQVAEVLLTAEAALADVAFDARQGCNEQLIREFRSKTIALFTIQGIGLISAEGDLGCTSFGLLEPPLRIEPGNPIQPESARLRFFPPAARPYASGILATAKLRLENGSQVVVAFTPDLFFGFLPADVLGNDAYIGVAMLGIELATRGVAATRASNFISVTRDAGVFDAKVTVKASRQWALASWRDHAAVTASLGGVAGIVLVIGAARFAGGRVSLASELRDGLDNQEFEIWYQPVIDLRRHGCAGAEALIRWRHPERDLISPDLFISLAEETGIIIPITRWLMEQVGKDMGKLLRADPALHIAINLSPAHMSNHEIVEDARATIERYGIRPSQILFELTERGLIDDPHCREVVEALSALGSEVAIDDFGTGYSSLAYIDKFRLDYLKIDKAFVSAIGSRSPSVRLTDVIIDMANSLGLQTIAEGVETHEQALYLRERGVRYAQGWYFSKPLSTDAFIAFVRDPDVVPSVAGLRDAERQATPRPVLRRSGDRPE